MTDPEDEIRQLFRGLEPQPAPPPPRARPPTKGSAMIADLFPHAPRAPVSFVVPGEPVPWSRAAGGPNGRRFVTPAEREARRLIRDCCRQAGVTPSRGPMGVDVVASWLFPRTTWKDPEIDAVIARMRRDRVCCGAPKLSRPDADNLGKLILDSIGLNERDEPLAYNDDAQVHLVRVAKVWSVRHETRVRLWYGSVPPPFPERWWEPAPNADV